MKEYKRSERMQELMDAAEDIYSYDQLFEWGVEIAKCIRKDAQVMDLPDARDIRHAVRNMVIDSKTKDHGVFYTWADEALTIVDKLKYSFVL